MDGPRPLQTFCPTSMILDLRSPESDKSKITTASATRRLVDGKLERSQVQDHPRVSTSGFFRESAGGDPATSLVRMFMTLHSCVGGGYTCLVALAGDVLHANGAPFRGS